MTGRAIRTALMALAGLCLVVASLVPAVPSATSAAALSAALHAHHGAPVPDTPAPASVPVHDTACCTVAACPLMHAALPAVWAVAPLSVSRMAEPVAVTPFLDGLDRPPPLPPPRSKV